MIRVKCPKCGTKMILGETDNSTTVELIWTRTHYVFNCPICGTKLRL